MPARVSLFHARWGGYWPTLWEESVSTDSIVLRKDDHKEIRRLFRTFRKAENATEDDAPRSPAQPSALKKTIDAVIS